MGSACCLLVLLQTKCSGPTQQGINNMKKLLLAPFDCVTSRKVSLCSVKGRGRREGKRSVRCTHPFTTSLWPRLDTSDSERTSELLTLENHVLLGSDYDKRLFGKEKPIRCLLTYDYLVALLVLLDDHLLAVRSGQDLLARGRRRDRGTGRRDDLLQAVVVGLRRCCRVRAPVLEQGLLGVDTNTISGGGLGCRPLQVVAAVHLAVLLAAVALVLVVLGRHPVHHCRRRRVILLLFLEEHRGQEAGLGVSGLLRVDGLDGAINLK